MMTVLIAEDEELSRASLIRLVRATAAPTELELLEASNGGEAVRLARAHRPELAFLDIVMPVMNGLNAAETILREGLTGAVYLLTAYDYFHFAQKAIDIGVKGYILKPPRAEDIRLALKKCGGLSAETGEPRQTAPVQQAMAGPPARAPHRAESRKNSYPYPHEAEKQFFNDLKQHNIERAYSNGDTVLTLLLQPENETMLIKEYINEFFVMFSRALVDLGYCTVDVINAHEWQRVYSLDSYTQIHQWAFERMYAMLEICRKKSTPGDAHKNRVLKTIDENIAGITIEALAQQEGVSKSYISRAFPDWTSETFTEYLTSKRIEKAKELLENTNQKVDKISAAVGYADVNYFSRVFKRAVGVTPGKYRGYKD